MEDNGHSSNSLAEAVNAAVGDLTGRHGGLDGSSVRGWKSGRVKWPKSATRMALQQVTGLPATALGFVPRGRNLTSSAPMQEESMKRRTALLGITAAAAAAAAPAVASPRRIGHSDVERLQRRFADVIASDHRYGGQRSIEQKAAEFADGALALQVCGSATQRVRRHLYSCAAGFRSSAMWAAIDGRRFTDAQTHMREAQAIAEMSGDQAIKFRIWSHTGTMYRHMGRPAEARAANDVARSLHINRRDPLFGSLGLARQAAIDGHAGDRIAARRALDEAQAAMDRADPDAYRPVWLKAFYDQAELDSLALSAYLALGDWQTAESHGHRCLSVLRPHMRRSLAITGARVARAQLEQGDIEPAVRTAMSVPAEAAAGHARVTRMLRSFGNRLEAIASCSTSAGIWTDFARSTWGTPP